MVCATACSGLVRSWDFPKIAVFGASGSGLSSALSSWLQFSANWPSKHSLFEMDAIFTLEAMNASRQTISSPNELFTSPTMNQILKMLTLASVLGLTGCTTTGFGFQTTKQNEDNSTGPLRIGIDPTYPPFTYKTSEGKPAGFDVDFAAALCAELQRDCVFLEQDWEQMIPALQAHKIDAIISSMQITSDRKKDVDFTQPYYRMPYVLIIRTDITYTTPASLKAKKIGVLQGGTDHLYANAELARLGAEVVPLPNHKQLYFELARAKVDGILGDAIEIRDGVLRQAWGKGFRIVGEPIYASQYFGEGAGIALRKSSNALKEQLNTAIQKLRTNGIYKAANDKYFDGYGQ